MSNKKKLNEFFFVNSKIVFGNFENLIFFRKPSKSYMIYKGKVPKKLQKQEFSGFGGFSGSRLPRPRATQWEFRDATC